MQVGALLIPGGIMGLIGILLIPTAFIVSKETAKPSPPTPPPISRICPHCGRVVTEETKFCPNCGKELG